MANLCLLSFVFLVTHHVDASQYSPSDLLTAAADMLKKVDGQVSADKIEFAKYETSMLVNAEKAEHVEQRMEETHFYIPRELTQRDVFKNFIDWKLQSGSETEKKYYTEKFTQSQDGKTVTADGEKAFIASLISKRTRAFMNLQDLTLLRKEHSDIVIWLPWHYIGSDTWEPHTFQRRTDDEVTDATSYELHGLWEGWVAQFSSLQHYTKYQMEDNANSFPFKHFTIYNYLSYDEMQLAALMIVAGPAKFHSNCQQDYSLRTREDYVTDGYIVGAIGPRFDKPGSMDFSLMVPVPPEKDKDQQLRAIMYGVASLPKPEEDDTSYIKMPWWDGNKNIWVDPELMNKEAFMEWAGQDRSSERIKSPVGTARIIVPIHRELYKQRLMMTFGAYFDFVHETMLKLNQGKQPKDQKKAYVMVLALGGGVWAIDSWTMPKYTLPAIRAVLEERKLAFKDTIETVHFVGRPGVWSKSRDDNDIELNSKFDPIEGIQLKDAPTATTQRTDDTTVRFTVYPWDSNALPGNEWWIPEARNRNWPGINEKGPMSKTAGLISLWEMSGDPAAACCSDIIYTQNWMYNTQLQTAEHVKSLLCSKYFIGPGGKYNPDVTDSYTQNHFYAIKKGNRWGWSFTAKTAPIEGCTMDQQTLSELALSDTTVYDALAKKGAVPKRETKDRRNLQTEEQIESSRDLLASGLRSYSLYSVVLVTVILATAMFVVSFYWQVV